MWKPQIGAGKYAMENFGIVVTGWIRIIRVIDVYNILQPLEKELQAGAPPQLFSMYCNPHEIVRYITNLETIVKLDHSKPT